MRANTDEIELQLNEIEVHASLLAPAVSLGARQAASQILLIAHAVDVARQLGIDESAIRGAVVTALEESK